jgi:hypothetical protein
VGTALTDVIVRLKDGRTIHHYIHDDHPAIVFVDEEMSFRVKRADLSPIDQLVRMAKSRTSR